MIGRRLRSALGNRLAKTCVMLLFVAAATPGCDSGPKYPTPVPVAGKMTVKGKPLESGTLFFVPVDSKKSLRGMAPIQSGGAFAAQTHKLKDGLLPGEYKVFIEPPAVESADPKKPDKHPIPEIYRSPDLTKVQISITGPQTALEIAFP